jgi:phage-related baseplate assembly protein
MPTRAVIDVNPPAGSVDSLISALPSAPVYGLPYVPAIDFAVKDPALIVTEVIADYEAAFLTLTGVAKKLAPGDPVRLFLLTVCHWLSHQRTIIDFTGKENLLKYATGDYLDNIGALYGERTTRLPASPALTTLRFSLVAPVAFSAVIPKGTMVQAPNAVVFTTLKDGVIPSIATFVDVPAQALVSGEVGNGFAAGQITSIVNWNQPYAVQVANTVATIGGSDAETDDQYRYRIWLAIESFSTCGPHDAYEFWALSASPQIMQVVVYSAPDIAGEVWLFPLLKNGQLPTQPILDLVLASCNAREKRPLTDYVSAFIPTVFTYKLNMDYWVEKDNEVLLDTIKDNVEQAVKDWILWQRSYVSRDLNCDELAKRCLQAGAKRIVVHSPLPEFQVMAYNQLACHNETAGNEPVVNFVGLEDA